MSYFKPEATLPELLLVFDRVLADTVGTRAEGDKATRHYHWHDVSSQICFHLARCEPGHELKEKCAATLGFAFRCLDFKASSNDVCGQMPYHRPAYTLLQDLKDEVALSDDQFLKLVPLTINPKRCTFSSAHLRFDNPDGGYAERYESVVCGNVFSARKILISYAKKCLEHAHAAINFGFEVMENKDQPVLAKAHAVALVADMAALDPRGAPPEVVKLAGAVVEMCVDNASKESTFQKDASDAYNALVKGIAPTLPKIKAIISFPCRNRNP